MYRATPISEDDDGFQFRNSSELRLKTSAPHDYRIYYVGDDPLKKELFGHLKRAGRSEKAVDFIEGTDQRGRLIALCRLKRREYGAHEVLEIPESTNGRIVVDSREVAPEYPRKIESEEDVLNYYLWRLTDFKDYQGFMVKRDFWRFFDYKEFLKYREVVTFEYDGVFYVFMLWPYNHK